jgi:hypothetical protein
MRDPRVKSPESPLVRKDQNADAVSEIIGAILLIAIVVAFIAIIAVFLNSQTPTEQIPKVDYMIGMNNQNPPTLFITHNGGDTLISGSFLVYIDGVSRSYSISSGGNEWSLGKNLIIPLPPGSAPRNVVIVYNSSWSGSTMLGSVWSNLSTPDVVIPQYDIVFPNPTEAPVAGNGTIPDTIGSIINSSNFIAAIQKNASQGSIYFWKQSQGNGNALSGRTCSGVCYEKNVFTYWFSFTVTDTTPSSSITYGQANNPSKILLSNGDQVNLSFIGGNINYMKTFGIAPQIWEFAGSPVTLDITFANGTILPQQKNIEILHTYVGSYSNLASALYIETWTNSVTALVVNGTERINAVDSRDIMFSNVRPLPIGLYVIATDSGSSSMLFVGAADGIYYNNVRQILL